MSNNLKIPYGSVPSLVHSTALHQFVFRFTGVELIRLEYVAEENL